MTPILSVENLGHTFPGPAGWFGARKRFRAVGEVDFELHPGEILGVVGESGCGKSTLARLIMRLYEPTDGTIRFEGTDITHLSRRALQPLRRRFQMVFQDPYSSIDPRQTIAEALTEPFEVQGVGLSAAARRAEIERLLALVALDPAMAGSHPHHLSGGQKQRVGIARALALGPRLIAFDEPTASLDVSVQAQVVELLLRLRRELDLTYLFISHDLALVDYLCDRVMVMYLGRVVEILPRGAPPRHPYTQALLAAAFAPDPKVRRHIVRITGEIPSGYDVPTGCAFAARCPLVEDTCRAIRPALVGDGHHAVACHLAPPIASES
ncbi:ATP-binding cassette domain-containing protein [Siculibacillus lacustris]|uniref:ATP-binding cassette domain-containing protein n=1 Tax=Siculibacillus lacustris TaxID=1549641 RepID=A0A4Q9VPP5_9HYPH|nr:oligopeptide/dipeptide ABC transporter ATP-binding protein [Siculibacillus lacustris]TBW36807.1 ATP-binding cassette domain-containing protein [Siculibacillus lacustris]